MKFAAEFCGRGLALLCCVTLLAALPAPATLVAHLSFDKAASLNTDSSGNGNDAAIGGSPTAAAGLVGGAANFDGASCFVWQGSNNPIVQTLNGSFTICLWVKTTQNYASDTSYPWDGAGIVGADYPGTPPTGDTIPLALCGSKVAGFVHPSGHVRSASAINTGEWVHLSFVRFADAAGYVQLYVNGNLESTNVSDARILSDAQTLSIGANLVGNRNYAGFLDDFRIYDTALSQNEITLLFNGSTAPPATAAMIDSFAVGPQSHALGPGDSYWSESASDLDSAQVLGGGRSLTLLADEDAAFRTLEEGSFSAVVSGSSPGSMVVQAAVVTPPQASSYEPAFLLGYNCPPADWSGFDRIVVRFATPPTADVALQTSLNSGGDGFWADTVVPAGTQSATILFSELNGSVPVSLEAVTSLYLQWTLPAVASLTLRDIQVMGAGVPERPQLNLSLNSGMILSWPTNVPGFFLESTTNLAMSFTPMTNEPVGAGTNYTVTLPGAHPVEFFRLHKP